MKKCVFTCITGIYDRLNDVVHEDGFDYICFTNNRLLTSDTWKIIYIDENYDNAILQRKVKILSYQYLPDYDLTIYIDAPIVINKSLDLLLDTECQLDLYDMVCFKHQERDCVYDEIEACSNLNKESEERLSRLKLFLQGEKYPEHNGLTENTVLIRKNIDEVNRLMDDWFSMILNYSRRDQLSFNYCLWKRPVKIKLLDMYVFDNPYFTHMGHRIFDYFSYRIGFDNLGCDYRLVKDRNVSVINNEVFICHTCIRDTFTINLYFHNKICVGIRSLNINNDHARIDYVGFETVEGFKYINEGCYIVFTGRFKKDDGIVIRIEFINSNSQELTTLLYSKYHELTATTESQKEQVQRLTDRSNRLVQELQGTHASISYRAGRTLTCFPRKMRGVYYCLKEHGWRYAISRVMVRINPSFEKKKNVADSTIEKCNLSAIVKDYNYYFNLDPTQYEEEIKLWYQAATGKVLDLSNPQTYNEKLQWLKLFDKNPLKTRLADKYLVREWIKEKIGEEHLIPLIGVWDSFEEINWELLPEQFAMKATHGSGWNLIVRDKEAINYQAVQEQFDAWLKMNYAYVTGLELHYLGIKPRIIAEQYIVNSDGDTPDYKLWCFNGKVEFIQVIIGRGESPHMALYDCDWNLLPFSTGAYPLIPYAYPRPLQLEEMIQIAETLSEGFPHVRVDLYLLDSGAIKFGEMTFTTSSGITPWTPPEADFWVGEMLTLPAKETQDL